MKTLLVGILTLICIFPLETSGQSVVFKPDQLEGVGVRMALQELGDRKVVQVVKDSSVKDDDEPTFVKLKGSHFKDGTIEVLVLSRLRADAPLTARGFIGVAFRINDSNTRFECIYIRPTNGRADDQIRRNHSIQYFSFPDFKYSRLRKESPEKYESYADMGLNEWIKMKIVVSGTQARLFLNDNKVPSLIVNDLKLGADASGAIGLFVDMGTEGYFADLKVSR